MYSVIYNTSVYEKKSFDFSSALLIVTKGLKWERIVRTVGFVGMGSDRVIWWQSTHSCRPETERRREREQQGGMSHSSFTQSLWSTRGVFEERERGTDLFSNQRPLFCAWLLSILERSSIKALRVDHMHQHCTKQHRSVNRRHTQTLHTHIHRSHESINLLIVWSRWAGFKKKLSWLV